MYKKENHSLFIVATVHSVSPMLMFQMLVLPVDIIVDAVFLIVIPILVHVYIGAVHPVFFMAFLILLYIQH